MLVQIAALEDDVRWRAGRFRYEGTLRQGATRWAGAGPIRAKPGASKHVRIVRQMELRLHLHRRESQRRAARGVEGNCGAFVSRSRQDAGIPLRLDFARYQRRRTYERHRQVRDVLRPSDRWWL